MHSVNLLPQEDVHGQKTSESMQGLFDLVCDVVPWEFPQHVVSHSVDDGLSGVSGFPSNALLRLHAQDRVEDALGGVDLKNNLLQFWVTPNSKVKYDKSLMFSFLR